MPSPPDAVLRPLMSLYYHYADLVARLIPSTTVNGEKIEVLPSVCPPCGNWDEIADYIPQGSNTLELGSGTGHITISLALKCARVTATDINPTAVENTRRNLERRNLDNVRTLVSDVFSAIDGQYDAIAVNPPWMSIHFDDPKKLWASSESFMPTIVRQASRYLADDGLLVFCYPSDKTEGLVDLATGHGLRLLSTNPRKRKQSLRSRLLEAVYLNVGLGASIFVFQKTSEPEVA